MKECLSTELESIYHIYETDREVRVLNKSGVYGAPITVTDHNLTIDLLPKVISDNIKFKEIIIRK